MISGITAFGLFIMGVICGVLGSILVRSMYISNKESKEN